MRSKPTGPVATAAPETRRSARTASSTSAARRGGRSPGSSSSVTASAQRRSGSAPKPGGTSRLASGQPAAMSRTSARTSETPAAEIGRRLADEHADQWRQRVVEMPAAGDTAVERGEDRVEGLVRALEAVLALGDLHRERPQHGGAQRFAIVDLVADVQPRVLHGARRRLEQRQRAARVRQRQDQRAALVEEGAVERPVAVERRLASLVRVEHERHLAAVRDLAGGQGEGGLHEAQERLSQLPVEHACGRDEDAGHADAVRARGSRSCRAAAGAERSRCRLARPAHSP